MGKYWSFSGAWERNERAKAKMGIEREGVEDIPLVERRIGGKSRMDKPDSALGFDDPRDTLLHINGTKVTVLGEVPVMRNGKPTGDVELYVQSEDGGTYRQTWAKTREGRHEMAERPKRIYGGF